MTWEHRRELRADPGAAPGDRNIDAPRRRRSVWPSIAVVAAAAAFGGVIWYAYKSGHEATGSGPPPLVKADTAPVKVKPDQPGGQEASFQDSTVYDRVGPNGQKPQVEKLLPPPEPPVPRPQPSAQASATAVPGAPPVSADPVVPQPSPNAVMPNDNSPTALAPAPGAVVTPAPRPVLHPIPSVLPHSDLAELPKKQPPAAKTQAAVAKPAPVAKPAVAAPPAAPKTAKPLTIADLENKALQKGGAPALPPKPVVLLKSPTPAKPVAVAAPVPPVKPEAPRSAGGGAFRVQLLSARTSEAAMADWDKLRRRFPDLAGVSASPVKADIAGKGTYYRLQAGPFDQSAAKSACGHLQAQGQGCIVVKP